MPKYHTLNLQRQDLVLLHTLVGARITDLHHLLEPRPENPDHLWYANARYMQDLQALLRLLDVAIDSNPTEEE